MTDLVDPVDLYLVRHGQARAADGSYDHRTPLSALGRRQAAAVPEALASAGIAAVYASPATRAIETAQPLAAAVGLTTQTDERLLEFEIEGWNPDAEEGQKGDWQIWRADHRGTPNGETVGAFAQRVSGAFDELVERHAGAAVAVVSHAGTTDAAIRWAMGMPSDSEWRHDFDLLNASVVEMLVWPRGRHPEGAPRHATIRRAPNLDHLPAELRSDF